MIHRFSLIAHAKSSKIVLSGELANSSPLAFAEGLLFYKNSTKTNHHLT